MRFSLRLALLALFALILGSASFIFQRSAGADDTQVCAPQPAGMVSWWRGNGNANDSKGTNNGALQGNATFAAGKVAQGFSFDGSAGTYVNVPDNSNLYPQAGSFTVDAWIKTSETIAHQTIITHYECSLTCPPGSFSVYELYTNNGKLEGDIRDSNGTDQILTGTAPVADGAFHHVAMQRDMEANPQKMRLYVDGVEDASATLTAAGNITNNNNEANPVTIGAIIQNSFNGCGCAVDRFSGVIDEVEYINRALSQSEIGGIFNAGSVGKCTTCIPPPPGMVSLWPGEGNGNDIRGENNGTPTGVVTFPTGEVEHAFNFAAASNSGVIVPSSNALNPTAGITLDAWVNPSSFPNLAPAVIRRDTNTG